MSVKRFNWTIELVAELKRRYPHEKSAAIAQDFGCKVTAVYNKAKALNLKKTKEFLLSEQSGRMLPGDARGKPTRFKTGHQTWNTGTHFTAGGRSVDTRFKPGHKPHKTRPVGTYRITKDGTLQQKISDLKGNNSRRWRSVHEQVWIAANGPVPSGHIVVFKTGMRTTVLDEITIDRVECISLAENLKRNTIHRLPKELADVARLKGVLQRVINKRVQHEEQH